MFPSNSNGNTSLYSNQPRTSFCNNNHDNHSKPSQDHSHPPPFSSLHLCYPYYIPLEDESIIHELSLQQQQQQQPFSNYHNYHATVIVAHENSTRTTTNIVQSTMDNNGKFVTADASDLLNSHVILENKCLRGKRSSKKDRHSKINTARGPRDRRMRLSLDVAKKFFRLQDMLGFDKASNTIEWLLLKSKPAIRDLLPQQLNQSCSLMGVSNSSSSASECEVVSGIDDQSVEKTEGNQVITIDKAKATSSSSNKEKKKLDSGVTKSAYIHHPLAKETREKARARARKRTTEKRNNKLACGGAGDDQYSKFRPSLDQVMDHNVNRLGSWIPFEETQVQTIDQAEYPSSHFQIKQGVVCDNSLPISTNWSPSLFNYQHNPGPSHEHQFSEFQILGKPWEGNNN